MSQIAREVLQRHYQGKQFEYGWASLCRMNLPENLEGMTVLDVACRRGKGVFKLSDRVGQSGMAIGLDWAEPYIAEAQEKCEKAWRDSGLPANNMQFVVGYPEDLAGAGIKDDSLDFIYCNSVINLTYDPAVCLAEFARVLKPGGLLVLEAVTASVPRNGQVLEKAKAMGNSIQSAPYEADLMASLEQAGFVFEERFQEQPVFVDTGYKADYTVEYVESDEEIAFTASVLHVRKPEARG